jgi:hypothetical protein
VVELARDGLAAHRLARRTNTLVLLDDGISCALNAKLPLLDDNTVKSRPIVPPPHDLSIFLILFRDIGKGWGHFSRDI